MKIAIIENERREVEGAFEYANFKYFQNALEFKYFESAQSFMKEDVNDYILMFVDIHLSKKSQLDGYGLMHWLMEQNPEYQNRIIVLTGHHKVEEKMTEIGLPKFPVIFKPTDFNVIYEQIKKKGINTIGAVAN